MTQSPASRASTSSPPQSRPSPPAGPVVVVDDTDATGDHHAKLSAPSPPIDNVENGASNSSASSSTSKTLSPTMSNKPKLKLSSSSSTTAAAAAAAANRRPPLRQNFDLEPNPFEQSFSVSSRSSSSLPIYRKNSPDNNHKDAAGSDAGGGANKPVLPPLAALSSGADGQLPWGLSSAELSNSLRSGPLSPAMLPGPASKSTSVPASSQAPQSASATSAFDPSSFRTGLTPGSGLTPLVAGPVSFPPPSPNTAAFFAMVSGTTNPSSLGSTAATITPNTLSALTSVLNGTHQPQPHPLSVSHSAYDTNAYAQRGGTDSTTQTNGFIPTNASTAASTAANGLFLLSQAHQELTKREEAQRAAQTQQPTLPARGRGSKRQKSVVSVTPITTSAPKRPRKGRGTTAATMTGSDDDSDDDVMMEEALSPTSAVSPTASRPGGGQKQQLTEEEKRRNFLERNRQAALKCRQRKKAWLTQLQAKVEYYAKENEKLTSALVSSREEISRLSALLAQSAHSGGTAANGVVGVQPGSGGAPVSVPVSIAPPVPSTAARLTAAINAVSKGYGD